MDQSPGRPSPTTLKHWRSFDGDEWRHVADGVIGFAVGSALPLLFFYLALRNWSFTAAVLIVLAWSAGAFWVHRRRTGEGDVFSAVTFAFAILEALIGLLSQNVTLYLATPSLKNAIYAVAFLGSAVIGRPLLALYAQRLYPIPVHVRRAPAYRRVMLVTSAVWFVGLLIRGTIRLWLLSTLPMELFLIVDNTIAGWGVSAALVGFTLWYPLRALRKAGLIGEAPVPVQSTPLAEAAEVAA